MSRRRKWKKREDLFGKRLECRILINYASILVVWVLLIGILERVIRHIQSVPSVNLSANNSQRTCSGYNLQTDKPYKPSKRKTVFGLIRMDCRKQIQSVSAVYCEQSYTWYPNPSQLNTCSTDAVIIVEMCDVSLYTLNMAGMHTVYADTIPNATNLPLGWRKTTFGIW